MKRFLLSLSLLFSTSLLAGTARYIVLLRAPLPHARVRELNDVREFQTLDAFAANLDEKQIADLRASGNVRAIETIKERHISDPVERTRVSGQAGRVSSTGLQQLPYGVDLIHAPSVWPVGRGEKINVVVIDTGIDIGHPDLVANYAGGYNTYARDDAPLDDNHHGTHVAGIVGAADNDIGVVGVAPKARIWAVKVLNDKGFGDNEHIAAGIDWVIAKKRANGGNWIISMSFGGDQPSDIEEAVIKRASAEGILLVAAAGNRSWPYSDWPAAYPQVMGVSAIDGDKNLATFTSGGDTLSVAAPGVAVLSTVPVGTALVADVKANSGDLFSAAPLTASPRGETTGDFVFCGYGKPEEFPASVAGKIAVIRRGLQVAFAEKTRNAKAAGAKSVIILNGKDDLDKIDNWTLIRHICNGANCIDNPDDLIYDWPLALAMSYSDGEKLLALMGKTTITESYRADDYMRLSGTSMATPHVSATAALIWSIDPGLTADQVRSVIETTAIDEGPPGADAMYGHGVIDALAAAQRVAPEKFGLPPIPTHRRTGGH